MTKEQEQILSGFFTRFGSPSTNAEIRVIRCFQKPETLDELERVERDDHYAEETIKELEDRIRQLSTYRIALAERYNYLATAPSVPVVRLNRQKNYDGKVFYYLTTHSKNLLDGHEVQTSCKKYSGAERHTAIADYKQYVKSHPGIIAEMNIQKSKWER